MSATIKHIDIKGVQIPVIFEEQKALPILNLQLVFQNSGYIQDKNKSGLVNLSSKLLNEGTKELGATKFAEKLEENAISLATSNGFETFVIELSNLKEQSKKGIELLTALLKSPNYSQDTLNKLKTMQIGSLKRKENDFDYVSNNQLKSILFKGTSLENPASGTIESISNIELKDIENFITQTVCLENLIIVAGGDYELKEFEKLVKPFLETLNVGKKVELEKVNFTSKKEETILIKDTQQAYIYFGSSFNIDSKDEENYKAKVASFILGGSGFGSRLMEEIRVKRGLAYSAYGSISINKSHSYFNGYLQTKNETSDEAKKLVGEIIEDFVKNGVTQDELSAAKNFLTGSEPLRNETLSQRLSRAFTLYYRGLEPDYSKKELEKIQTLELTDLNNYIKSHSEINNLTFSIVRK
ncbi:M16 family metallopeptidase [Arcobacter suis]|uniref:Peptidase, M16 family n=1 Tax=Arcobacter suis CECT 7833 TaxID=663365 RepID=A0AAD0SQG1_9BACT|nr:pitrilysin family protein [Arcobacter suis]AXX89798.1 peptidase, M16 family [Arcobacter suis CECT 7833]